MNCSTLVLIGGTEAAAPRWSAPSTCGSSRRDHAAARAVLERFLDLWQQPA